MGLMKDRIRFARAGAQGLVALTVGLGMLVTAAVFAELRSLEHRSIAEQFDHQAEVRTNLWIAALEDRLAALDSLGTLYSCSDDVGRDEFRIFARKVVLRHQEIRAVHWVPRVPAEARRRFEQQARRDGLERFQIRGHSQDSTDVRKDVTYWPVYYSEPLTDSLQTPGLDLGGDPSWRKILDRVGEAGRIAVATAVCFPEGVPSDETAYCIRPVYRRNSLILTARDRRENLAGFIIGVFDIGLLVESSLVSTVPGGIDIELMKRTPQGLHRLYFHPSRRRLRQSPAIFDESHHASPAWEKPIRMGEEQWVVRCTASDAFLDGHHSIASFGSLALGMAITCLLAIYVRNHQLRYEKVERLVAERTEELDARKTELKHHNDFLHHVLANIPAFVFWKDRNCTYLGCNENFARSAGVGRPDNIVGKTDHDLIWKNDANMYQQDDRGVMDSGQPLLAFEETQTTEDGRQINLLTSKVPLRDSSGVVVGVLGVYTDITERKLAEQRQAALLKEVASTNAELTDFAHVVSHDLKAPLRGIRTLADWLAADPDSHLSEESQEHVKLLTGRVDRMYNLIDGILEYSRVARTRQKRERVNLNARLADIIDSLAPPEHISIVVDEGLPAVWGEPTRLTQLFQNLIGNAIKYMDKERGLIRVGRTREQDEWRFFVSDNGPGIPDRHFERVFQLFQTLSSKETSESTGVGLAVAKKIVELHGGRLWVESKLGEGATFFLTLPKMEMEEADALCTTADAC